MKKLILSVAIVLSALSMHARTTVAENSILNVINIQDEYKEVALDALPAAVTSTIEKSFPKTKLEKAYVNEKKQYKLEIANGDKKYTVYTDAEGNIIKK